MNFFHHIHLTEVDPLGDGLGDEIAAEQAEPEAIVLDEDFDRSLAEKWQDIIEDAKKDPDYIDLIHSMDE